MWVCVRDVWMWDDDVTTRSQSHIHVPHKDNRRFSFTPRYSQEDMAVYESGVGTLSVTGEGEKSDSWERKCFTGNGDSVQLPKIGGNNDTVTTRKSERERERERDCEGGRED